MKTVVVYRSRTGFTQKYAQWISQELEADLYERQDISLDQMLSYDTIIYGGGLYASGISGLKQIKRNIKGFEGKNIVVFATGATPSRPEEIEAVRNANIPESMRSSIPLFYMRGGFDYSRLSPLYKVIMSLLKISLKSKRNMTTDERGMLAAFDHPADFTKKARINELIEYVVGLSED